MTGRALWALAATSAVVVACNALTGIGDLGVGEVAADAASPTPEAAPTTVPTTTIAPPEMDASVDAASDADATVDATVDSGPPPPPPNIGTFNGHRYEVVLVDTSIAWGDAKAAAVAKGGHLVTFTSEAENAFVGQLVAANNAAPGNYGPWFGATKPQVDPNADGGPADPAANWSWITGEAWSYTNWLPSQPDNDDLNENFLGGLGDPANGQWNDYREEGDGEVFSYVIEYEHL